MNNMIFLAPLRSYGERVWRTYLGGKLLDEFTGKIPPGDGHFPEEWIFSTVTARNPGREDIEEGLCYVEAGDKKISIRELLEKHPIECLGPEHNQKYYGKLGVLIKLIDSQERLTVQVHPDKTNALRFFNAPFGKTECWHILNLRKDAPEDPCLYLGFKEGITKKKWRECFEKQAIPEMLALMHQVHVSPGETYLIRGGLPHAIGPGCLLVEIQEPTDYTLRVERTTPSGFLIDDALCHQGIGYDAMFECFDYNGMPFDEMKRSCMLEPKVHSANGYRITEVVGYENTECFKMERIEVTSRIELTGTGRFSGLVILSGSGELTGTNGVQKLMPNDQFFIPAVCEPFQIAANSSAPLVFLRCYGPQ